MENAKALVVVVDDDEDMAKAIKRLLTTAGFEVAMFTSAEAYLNSEHVLTPSCLVLDVHLPGKSGFELYALVQQSGQVIPAIFMSAFDDDKYQQQARELNAMAYLVKPFVGHELIDVLKQKQVGLKAE